MFGYIVRRLISAFLVVIAISMIVFALFFLGPTNTADYLCNQNGHCTPREARAHQRLARARQAASSSSTPSGQRDSFTTATISFGGANTYECNAPCFGISFITQTQVTDELREAYPATLSLAIGGATLYLLLGVTTGVLSARRRGTLADKALVGSTLVVSSIPYYLVAFLVLALSSSTSGDLPRRGVHAVPRESSRLGHGAAAALARPRRLQLDPVRPVQPRIHGRGPGRGLRPHGDRQGRPHPDGHDQACAARSHRARS